jgi:hypothetical protein
MRSMTLLLIVLFGSLSLLPIRSALCFNGYIEARALHFPNWEDITESRNRVLVEGDADLGDRISLYVSGCVDALLSNREEDPHTLLLTLDDAYVNWCLPRLEVKVGYSKVYWGKLDQLSPTDIVNPLDVSKLFLETERTRAKLALPLFSASSILSESSQLEVIIVPVFREGTYDGLNEESSPFRLTRLPAPMDQLPMEEERPPESLENMEYGGRFSSTSQGVDWSLYWFRGFTDFPAYRIVRQYNPSLGAMIPHHITAEYSRSDMVGCDFELAAGRWGIRGEGALFSDQAFQKAGTLDYAKANSLHAGFGTDRSFGQHYLSLSALYKKVFTDEDIEERKQEVTLLINLERKFAYERWIAKLFSIYNTMSNSLFFKGTLSVNMVENLWADVSIGVFQGTEDDTLGKARDSDFCSITLRHHF